jgi:hypothetical protein
LDNFSLPVGDCNDLINAATELIGVAREHGAISLFNFSRVIDDNDLGGKAGASFRWGIFHISSDIALFDILFSNISNADTNSFAWKSFSQAFFVGFNGFDLTEFVSWLKLDDLSYS